MVFSRILEWREGPLLKTTYQFRRWYRGLDPDSKIAVDYLIDKMVDGKPGSVKPVGGGAPADLHELRQKTGSGLRVYIGMGKPMPISKFRLLLWGGDKSSQERKDIGTATRILIDTRRK
jgi:putative addiction module killer protein